MLKIKRVFEPNRLNYYVFENGKVNTHYYSEDVGNGYQLFIIRSENGKPVSRELGRFITMSLADEVMKILSNSKLEVKNG